jgi:hypothetical protein
MGRIHVGEPADFTGRFAWKDEELQANINLVKKDYKRQDPRKFPRIHKFHINVCFPLTHMRVPLPILVAYSKEVLKELMNNNLIKTPSVATTARHEIEIKEAINYRFRFWPFNFDRFGELRTKVGIPKPNFEFWLAFVNGLNWESDEGAAAVAMDQATEQERPVEVFRPAEPYESVLREQPLHQHLGLQK